MGLGPEKVPQMTTPHVDTSLHPIRDRAYANNCRARLEEAGALVLQGFFASDAIARVVRDSAGLERLAFYAASTHNVYLTPPNPELLVDHPFNRQVESSKGLIADDQIPSDSPLRDVYDDVSFRDFLGELLGIDQVHPYADDLSSINVHYASAGRELGWHFDNSSFAVTMLLQAPEAGGVFEYVPNVRTNDTYEHARIGEVLEFNETPLRLDIETGDLVVFRGHDALHRVTPTQGRTTRLLAVFAFNDQPGVSLSESALTTFFGRTR